MDQTHDLCLFQYHLCSCKYFHLSSDHPVVHSILVSIFHHCIWFQQFLILQKSNGVQDHSLSSLTLTLQKQIFTDPQGLNFSTLVNSVHWRSFAATYMGHHSLYWEQDLLAFNVLGCPHHHSGFFILYLDQCSFHHTLNLITIVLGILQILL